MQQLFIPSIGVQVCRQNAGLLTGLQHDGAGAVAKKHAGGTIFPVKDAGEYLRADHQRFFARTGTDELLGSGQRIDETAAHGLNIKGGAALNTEPGLQDTGATGEHLVRRGGGKNNQINIGGLNAGGLNGVQGRLFSKIYRALSGQGNMPLFDTSAFADPLIRGLHLLFQVAIGNDVIRQIGTGSGNACKGHGQFPGVYRVTIDPC